MIPSALLCVVAATLLGKKPSGLVVLSRMREVEISRFPDSEVLVIAETGEGRKTVHSMNSKACMMRGLLGMRYLVRLVSVNNESDRSDCCVRLSILTSVQAPGSGMASICMSAGRREPPNGRISDSIIVLKRSPDLL